MLSGLIFYWSLALVGTDWEGLAVYFVRIPLSGQDYRSYTKTYFSEHKID